MMKCIIIGSGFAGYSVARELRQLDQQAELIIVTEDNGDFYSKPLLSKALTEQRSIEMLRMKSAAQLAKELNATILTQTNVSKIDIEQQTIVYQHQQHHQQVKYDKLVLACGAKTISPPIEGNAVDDILQVNNLEDYDLFCQKITGQKHVALIGAGLVGCEFANDLSNTDHQVDVVSLDRWPLPKLLPESIAKLLRAALEKNGVHFHMGKSVRSVNKDGQQYAITLSDDTTIKADIVLSAIGLLPNIALAKEAGITTKQGIVTDQYLQTSAKNVYAIGDCAEVCGLVRQHIAPIRHAATALAKNIMGQVTELYYPAMAIGVKTPCYQIVVCPPLLDPTGEWDIEIDSEQSCKALHYNQNKKINGFILTGKKVAERAILEKQLTTTTLQNVTPPASSTIQSIQAQKD